jgi:hypothetical protein
MNAQLTKIRRELDNVNSEIASVQNALPPIAERLNDVAQALELLTAPWNDFVAQAAEQVVLWDRPITLSSLTPHRFNAENIAELGLAAAIASYGAKELRDAIRQKAAEIAHEGQLRLTATERATRLKDLYIQRYRLEFTEEQNLDGAPRRPGVNAAAVMGVPLEVAQEHHLLEVA